MKRNAIPQVKTEAKQKAENPNGLVKYEAGKFLLDTSKLVFAGVIKEIIIWDLSIFCPCGDFYV